MVHLSSQSIALIQLMLDAFIKSAVILSAAGLLAASLRRASAASRHLVWSVAMASLLALPVLSVALPAWRTGTLPPLETVVNDEARDTAGFNPGLERVMAAPVSERVHRRPSDIVSVGAESPASNSGSPRFDAAPKPEESSWGVFDWKIALALAWLAGAFAVIARLAIGSGRIWFLTRRAQGVETSWVALARTLAVRLRLRGRVRIFKTDRISAPMTWGLARPAVLLPEDADEWSAERRWIVMAHELTHVKRRDCLIQTLAQLACAVYWFNPLVWIAARRLRVERELACDDHVLEAGAKASDYASHLVEIAGSIGAANCGSPVAVGMACSHLESRVRSILDPNARRRGVNGLKVALAAVIAVVLTTPLAMLRPWGAAEASGRTDFNSINRPDPSSAANLFQKEQADKAREAKDRQKQDGQRVEKGREKSEEPGELDVDDLIAMKALGVTPEYIESIRKLGYSELTAEQAIELRSLGIDEEFVKQARGWTKGNPSTDELVELKSIGMSAEFINGMKRAGYNNLTTEELVELKAVGVSPEFVESMRRAGLDKLSADDLVELKSVGVDEALVKEAQGWGFGKLSNDDLVEIKSIGINPEYARSMKALGFDNLSLEDLVGAKAVGVDAVFVKELRELGFDKLTLEQLVEMKAVGVTPDYIRKMRAAGLKNVSVDELIKLKATGVDKIITREKR
jgi:beta-lactamase regulating signal transducer with metallopeptidase domain